MNENSPPSSAHEEIVVRGADGGLKLVTRLGHRYRNDPRVRAN